MFNYIAYNVGVSALTSFDLAQWHVPIKVNKNIFNIALNLGRHSQKISNIQKI